MVREARTYHKQTPPRRLLRAKISFLSFLKTKCKQKCKIGFPCRRNVNHDERLNISLPSLVFVHVRGLLRFKGAKHDPQLKSVHYMRYIRGVRANPYTICSTLIKVPRIVYRSRLTPPMYRVQRVDLMCNFRGGDLDLSTGAVFYDTQKSHLCAHLNKQKPTWTHPPQLPPLQLRFTNSIASQETLFVNTTKNVRKHPKTFKDM